VSVNLPINLLIQLPLVALLLEMAGCRLVIRELAAQRVASLLKSIAPF
jgi:hypothetical protein